MYGRCCRAIASPYVSLIIQWLCPTVVLNVLGWSLWLNGAVVSATVGEFGDV